MLEMLPKASATAVIVGWVSISGDSTMLNVTVSPGCQPVPVIVTIEPGG